MLPAGPTGFQRRDKAGRYLQDRRITQLQLDAGRQLLRINATPGPVFERPPDHFGLYGNGNSNDPEHYVQYNPFREMAGQGRLNGYETARDWVAGLGCGVLAWEVDTGAGMPFRLTVKLPVDDYHGADELAALSAQPAAPLRAANEQYWRNKLEREGLRPELPDVVGHLGDLFRICRSNLLILADHGQIHPGPTIYDDFWIRDSAIEGIAVAMAGDTDLARRQFGTHYPGKFNLEDQRIGPVSTFGFFGGDHEKYDREWDSNGQALWAIGRFDRLLGPAEQFGSGLYFPYVLQAARWLRDNRSSYGLLHSGWSAEHLGDKHQPHYWDDLWGIAGLYEAAKLAERIGASEAVELWAIYGDLRQATADSIRWVLEEQSRRGYWETFVPTGPGDVGRLDSTMIGALAYFHPCRLYMGKKLGADIDEAFVLTLDTIWHHFMDGGGFRHDAAWNCYGPYLSLQLAHCFLYLGKLDKMNEVLEWSARHAAFARISRPPSAERWTVVQGAWNEQHAYPIAKDFAEIPNRPWYMGDIPHGWACAEFLMLLRDMLFFEADEDGASHLYLAPGVMGQWLAPGGQVGVKDAPGFLGGRLDYTLHHDPVNKRVEIRIDQSPATVAGYRYTCPFGAHLWAVRADGQPLSIDRFQREIRFPPGTRHLRVDYA